MQFTLLTVFSQKPHLVLIDLLFFFLIALLIFVLKNNKFSFNQENNICGITCKAMGTKLAPALATLFLCIIEEEYIEKPPIKPPLW